MHLADLCFFRLIIDNILYQIRMIEHISFKTSKKLQKKIVTTFERFRDCRVSLLRSMSLQVVNKNSVQGAL